MNPVEASGCSEFGSEVSRYAWGDIPEDRRAAVEAHLKECASCQELVQFVRELTEAVREDPLRSGPAKKQPCYDTSLIVDLEAERLPHLIAKHMTAHIFYCKKCRDAYLLLRALSEEKIEEQALEEADVRERERRAHKTLPGTRIERRVGTAVIVASSLATRRLRSVSNLAESVLPPAVDKLLIQFALEEAMASGAKQIIIVADEQEIAVLKNAVGGTKLADFLDKRGKHREAKLVRDIQGMVHFKYLARRAPVSLGVAALAIRELVSDQAVAIIDGDVIFNGASPLTRQLIGVYEDTGVGTVAVEPAIQATESKYGMVEAVPAPGKQWGSRLHGVQSVGGVAVIPHWNLVGRYVLPLEFFTRLDAGLEQLRPVRDPNSWFLDALERHAHESGLWAYQFEGNVFNIRDKLNFLPASIAFAVGKPELGPEYREFVRSYIT